MNVRDRLQDAVASKSGVDEIVDAAMAIIDDQPMVKTFDTLDEMWLDQLYRVFKDGQRVPSRAGDSIELLGWSGRISDPRACLLYNPVRRLPPWYPSAELLWYLSGSDTLEMITAYAPQYERFSNEIDGVKRVHGAYGRRLADGELSFWLTSQALDRGAIRLETDVGWKGERDRVIREGEDVLVWNVDAATRSALDKRRRATQIASIISLLHAKPDTRQAILAMWSPSDLLYALAGTKNDIPCTLNAQFLIRDGRLNMIVNMRSNDLWLGTPNDVFCFCHLQILIATALRIPLGWYQHNVGSLHIYSRNEERAKHASQPPAFDTGPLEYMMDVVDVSSKIEEAIRIEKWNREKQVCADVTDDVGGGPNSPISQLLIMAACKWTTYADKRLFDPKVRKAVERARTS